MNSVSQNVTVHIRINMSGETVHDDSYYLEPDSEQFVYNTSTDDPDGSEEFSAIVTVDNVTRTVEIPTNKCYSLETINIIKNRNGKIVPNERVVAC